MWTFFTLNVDKKRHFLTTYPPHLVHVVFERPLRYLFITFSWKCSCINEMMFSFRRDLTPSYGATIPFWATYCRTKALFFWLTGDMAWLCAIKDSQQAAALYCALSRLGRSTLPDRSTKYCSSLLDGSFFNCVDQFLPIIDHLKVS